MTVEIVAEIAQAHDGSLGMLHSYIDALADSGVDTIKFQMHYADAESSELEPFRVNFSYEDSTRFDYWKRMEFSPSQWEKLLEHTDKVGLKFLCTPFSIKAVDVLHSLGVKRFKIGSGDTSNYLLLDKICSMSGSIILSSGMSTIKDLEMSADRIRSKGGVLDAVLQCTTMYPTPPEKVGLNNISEIKNKLGVDSGLSDHSGDIAALIAATSLGAKMLEFHACFSKLQFGPDSQSSLDINQIGELCRIVRNVEVMLQNPVDKSTEFYDQKTKSLFSRSLRIVRDIEEGDVINVDDLECGKPAGVGLSADSYECAIGRTVSRSLKKYDFINEDVLK